MVHVSGPFVVRYARGLFVFVPFYILFGGSLMLKPMLPCMTKGFSNGPISLKFMVVELHPFLHNKHTLISEASPKILDTFLSTEICIEPDAHISELYG